MKPKENTIILPRKGKSVKITKVFSTDNAKTVLTDKGGLKGDKVYTL